MSARMGLWIDHQKAIVVALTDVGEEIGRIDSTVESQLRRTGDSPLKGAFEPQQVPADDRQQRALTGHLNSYYDRVVERVREAQSILILGPGEAKTELRKRLEGHGLGARIVGVEAADKMTDGQLAAKVRQHFSA